MTELIPAPQSQALTMADQWRFAETVSGSSILPRAYKEDPGAVLVAVNLGSAMGLSPAESLYRIHVIEGKPSASAELITANVRKAGHRLRVHGDATQATVEIVRADDPEFPFRVTWTIQDAQRAGLTGKQVWKSYPAAMLKARAITECARSACPEALYGVIYTEDEARESAAEPETRPARESAADILHTATATVVEPEPESAPEPATVEPETEPVATPEQVGAIQGLMRDLGVTARPQILGKLSEMVGRKVTSSKELTKGEATYAIEALTEQVAALERARMAEPEPETAEAPPLDQPAA